MSEYIVEVDDQVADVFVERFDWKAVTLFGHHLVGEIVRCMDCTWFANDAMHGAWCKNLGVSLHDDYDGFCKWGEKR